MHPGLPEPEGRPAAPGVYEALAAADPAGRADIVLRLLGEDPHGRLRLPARDGSGAVLAGVDLGRPALRARPRPGTGAPPWWSRRRGTRWASGGS